MSQMTGKKPMCFLFIVSSSVLFTLTVYGFYPNTKYSGSFFDTTLKHIKDKTLDKLYHPVLSNSTSANHQSTANPQSTSISKNLTTVSKIVTRSFQNGSVHSSRSSGNQTTVKTSTRDESQNLQGLNKSNENANTKVTTAKQADNLTPPSRPKLQDSPSSENKSEVASTTPNSLYTHQGYLSVLDHKKKLNLHCMQCAYVSSSGQLLDSGAGYLIDEADCVFRMNNAPASGYEEDVGTRTTVRVIAHSSTTHLKKNHQILVAKPSVAQYVVGWGPSTAMNTAGKGFAYNTLRTVAKMYKKTGFFFLTQDQMKKADETFEAETGVPRMKSGTHLSTGWFTMLLARQACDEIHVYGMINDEYCQLATSKNVSYHYYNSFAIKECDYYRRNEQGKRSVHRFMTEKAIFARWALEQPPIYFHNPFWKP